MPPSIKISYFTKKHPGIVNVLVTDAGISQAFDHNTTTINKVSFKKYNSIWDTGATNSVISQKVVDECGLKPTGMVNIVHADGTSHCETYLVRVFLRNNVGIPQVKVTKTNLGPDTDVLIGMDIISLGDFAITNKDGKTVFSFRIPSVECIDFAKYNQTKTTS